MTDSKQTQPSFERKEIDKMIYPELAVLDFDRTLSDVDKAMDRLYAVAEAMGIDVQAIKEARLQTENDGGSFAPLDYLRGALSESEFAMFVQQYIDAPNGSDLLYADTPAFLERLEVGEVPFVVLTYGKDPLWQEMKVRASGYTGPLQIMDHTDKGLEIMAWNEDGTYSFTDDDSETYSAETVCLVDDKAAAFKSLEDGCRGFCLQRDEVQLASQQGDLKPNVHIIRSLDELQVVDGRIVTAATLQE